MTMTGDEAFIGLCKGAKATLAIPRDTDGELENPDAPEDFNEAEETVSYKYTYGNTDFLGYIVYCTLYYMTCSFLIFYHHFSIHLARSPQRRRVHCRRSRI